MVKWYHGVLASNGRPFHATGCLTVAGDLSARDKFHFFSYGVEVFSGFCCDAEYKEKASGLLETAFLFGRVVGQIILNLPTLMVNNNLWGNFCLTLPQNF